VEEFAFFVPRLKYMVKGINDTKKNKLMGSCETSEQIQLQTLFSLTL